MRLISTVLVLLVLAVSPACAQCQSCNGNSCQYGNDGWQSCQGSTCQGSSCQGSSCQSCQGYCPQGACQSGNCQSGCQGSCNSNNCPVPSLGQSSATKPLPSRCCVSVDLENVQVGYENRKYTDGGSGTLISPNAVLTCAHLFRDSSHGIYCSFPNGESIPATLTKIDTEKDLALLTLSQRTSIVPMQINTKEPISQVIGAGFGPDKHSFASFRGTVTKYADSGRTAIMSASAREGDSGGAITDSEHRLVGVIWGSNEEGCHFVSQSAVNDFMANTFPAFRGDVQLTSSSQRIEPSCKVPAIDDTTATDQPLPPTTSTPNPDQVSPPTQPSTPGDQSQLLTAINKLNDSIANLPACHCQATDLTATNTAINNQTVAILALTNDVQAIADKTQTQPTSVTSAPPRQLYGSIVRNQ